jgi:hypothetical protein|tara:strand:- start:671 stop:889 length:219 start_codon:yes stop_codon:yes gene_type:complete
MGLDEDLDKDFLSAIRDRAINIKLAVYGEGLTNQKSIDALNKDEKWINNKCLEKDYDKEPYQKYYWEIIRED